MIDINLFELSLKKILKKHNSQNNACRNRGSKRTSGYLRRATSKGLGLIELRKTLLINSHPFSRAPVRIKKVVNPRSANSCTVCTRVVVLRRMASSAGFRYHEELISFVQRYLTGSNSNTWNMVLCRCTRSALEQPQHFVCQLAWGKPQLSKCRDGYQAYL